MYQELEKEAEEINYDGEFWQMELTKKGMNNYKEIIHLSRLNFESPKLSYKIVMIKRTKNETNDSLRLTAL